MNSSSKIEAGSEQEVMSVEGNVTPPMRSIKIISSLEAVQRFGTIPKIQLQIAKNYIYFFNYYSLNFTLLRKKYK